MYSTLPILCNPGILNCSLNFELFTIETASNQDLIRIDACSNSDCSKKGCFSSILNNLNYLNSNYSAQWGIVPTIDPNNQLANRYLNFSISLVSAQNLASFWLNVSLPSIPLRFVPKPRPLTRNGYCTDDPHCKTFDQIYFEFQYREGEYVIYENIESQLRVHLISKSCASIGSYWSNYCIHGIYIQSIDDYISFVIKRAPALNYIDLSTTDKSIRPLIWRDKYYTFSKPGAIQVSQDEYSYYVSYFN